MDQRKVVAVLIVWAARRAGMSIVRMADSIGAVGTLSSLKGPALLLANKVRGTV
jgi:hypothetical protein